MFILFSRVSRVLGNFSEIFRLAVFEVSYLKNIHNEGGHPNKDQVKENKDS